MHNYRDRFGIQPAMEHAILLIPGECNHLVGTPV